MAYIDAASCMLAPSVNSKYQTLEGTTEQHNTRALDVRRYATLKVGAQAVRVVFRGEDGLSSQVTLTDLLLAAGERFDWVVAPSTQHVYVLAADGTSAFEAWVWESSSHT